MSDFGPANSLANQAKLLDREQAGEIVTSQMSARDLAVVDKRIKALKLLLKDEIRATYKLEVHFAKKRSRTNPFPGVIGAWLSGSKFHGGGDEKIYECPNPECRAWILPNQIEQTSVVERINGRDVEQFRSVSYCGTCGRMWKSEQTVGERLCVLTEQNWAYAIFNTFLRLKMDADIYLKYSPDDIRYRTAMEVARARGGEEINKARRLRGMHIYPLKNLIKDTKNGAEVYTRIRAFINA